MILWWPKSFSYFLLYFTYEGILRKLFLGRYCYFGIIPNWCTKNEKPWQISYTSLAELNLILIKRNNLITFVQSTFATYIHVCTASAKSSESMYYPLQSWVLLTSEYILIKEVKLFLFNKKERTKRKAKRTN